MEGAIPESMAIDDRTCHQRSHPSESSDNAISLCSSYVPFHHVMARLNQFKVRFLLDQNRDDGRDASLMSFQSLCSCQGCTSGILIHLALSSDDLLIIVWSFEIAQRYRLCYPFSSVLTYLLLIWTVVQYSSFARPSYVMARLLFSSSKGSRLIQCVDRPTHSSISVPAALHGHDVIAMFS